MKTFFSLVVAVSLTASLAAQTARKPSAKPKTAAVTADDIKALRDALAAQSSALAAHANRGNGCAKQGCGRADCR